MHSSIPFPIDWQANRPDERGTTGRCIAAALLIGTIVLLPGAAYANSEIWVCTDPETGAKTYTSKPRNTRNCRNTDLGSSRARTAPTSSAAAPASAPATRSAAARQPVSAETRGREADRKQILRDELTSESRKLAELQREFQGNVPMRRADETDIAKFAERSKRLTDEVERTRANIQALERELGRM